MPAWPLTLTPTGGYHAMRCCESVVLFCPSTCDAVLVLCDAVLMLYDAVLMLCDAVLMLCDADRHNVR
jgi:hypothetical protein